ncbi:melanotransferrin-like [Chiloscyllium plagiosum]|uniref:melanotransferrin-like n=1 Tax=Chiloscyllium plagiosum TaxID=36176 RepID=UPI001CB7F14C|nr:melanotransferrin-like [Chiloscyllium plagiosum]
MRHFTMKGAIVFISFVAIAFAKKFRWCNISEAEQRKCAELSKALQAVLPPTAKHSFTKLSCIQAHNTKDCIKKIRGNKADAISLDAGDIYTAARFYDLTVVAKEMYKDGGCLYSVAVVRNESLDIQKLKGKRSCHNGARRTAGWNIPLGFLLSRNYLHWHKNQTVIEGNPLLQSLSISLMSQSCFCSAAESESHRLRDSSMKASIFASRLEMISTRHATVGLSEWADGWSPDHFELLCPGGERAPVTEWERCNLGSIPPNIVMTRSVIATRIYDFLMKSQDHFGVSSDSQFQLFQSRKYGEKDLLFKDSTKCLAHATHLDYMSILGEEFSNLAESVFSCTESEILEFCTQNACSTLQV